MRPNLALVLLLAACADPRSACLDRADRPLRALEADIAETELALARGYRIASGPRVAAGMTVCADGNPLSLCLSGARPIFERRIAVDPAAERARLRALEARRPAVAAASGRAAATCPAS